MTPPPSPDADLENRLSRRLLDVLIRATLLIALGLLCYRVISPFLPLAIWAMILAVTLHPLQKRTAALLGGRPGLAATLLVLIGITVLVVPLAVLMSSMADSVRGIIQGVQQNTLQIPAPPKSIAAIPIIGPQADTMWNLAHDDLPAFVHSMEPKIGELARTLLAFAASLGGMLLGLAGALILAGVFMAFGDAGARFAQAVFQRLAGDERGINLTHLATATVRAVAQGVVGVALIQAILIGLALLIAGVPWAGALATLMLVLGIAQVPALLITIPAIIWVWARGDYGTGAAVLYTILLLVAGMADNVLKPLLLARGVEVPMPVILVGALGGMATGGIIGLFVGATLLALAWQIFTSWVHERPETGSSQTLG